MTESGLPYPDDDDDAISPDVDFPDSDSPDDEPMDPSDAVHREQDKYGETSADQNRGDQWDVHHGQPEDIV